MKNVNKIPFLIILMGVFSFAMLLPSIHALYLGLHRVAQAFFYSSLLFLTLTILLGLSLRRPRSQSELKNTLVSLVGFYVFVPFFLAVPLRESLVGINFISLYFEMVSCLTTTGATIFDASFIISEPIHLWRSLVGWLGGFVFLIIVFATLTPLKLGGFEIFRNDSQYNYVAPSYQQSKFRGKVINVWQKTISNIFYNNSCFVLFATPNWKPSIHFTLFSFFDSFNKWYSSLQ